MIIFVLKLQAKTAVCKATREYIIYATTQLDASRVSGSRFGCSATHESSVDQKCAMLMPSTLPPLIAIEVSTGETRVKCKE